MTAGFPYPDPLLFLRLPTGKSAIRQPRKSALRNAAFRVAWASLPAVSPAFCLRAPVSYYPTIIISCTNRTQLSEYVHMMGENSGLERVQFALRATGVKPGYHNPQLSGTHSRGYLPHVKREGASYFVTFRLADSLPKEVLMKLESRRGEELQRLAAQQDAFERGLSQRQPEETEQEINHRFHRGIERYLDRGAGQCFLAQTPIADLVADAIQFFEGQRYRLHAWVVMPNHAHAVVWPMLNNLLGDVVGSWKGFTARRANQMLNRVGKPFWQPEAFDHWVRNDEEKARICRYVVYNPVKAKLCGSPEEWRWSSAWPGWKNT